MSRRINLKRPFRNRLCILSTIVLLLLGLGVVISVLLSFSGPIFNDVSTDVNNLCQFQDDSKNSMSEQFKKYNKDVYPDLGPLQVSGKTSTEVTDIALSLAQKQKSWKIGSTQKEAGVFEGTDTTALLRFVDDWVIRVTSKENGSVRVDMRSKSRVGKSDLGKNAKRINKYFDLLQTDIKSQGGEVVHLTRYQASTSDPRTSAL